MDLSSDESEEIEIVSMSFQGVTVCDDDEDDDAPSLSSSSSFQNLSNDTKPKEGTVRDGTFSWSLLDGLEGTITRTYKAEQFSFSVVGWDSED